MKYLLDTNALIGLLFRPDFLSDISKEVLEESTDLYVSIMSLWEIGIKQSIGKIDIASSAIEMNDACKELGVDIVPLRAAHIDQMKQLPMIHRDPFDRIIISQAMVEEMVLITSDAIIPKYGVEILW